MSWALDPSSDGSLSLDESLNSIELTPKDVTNPAAIMPADALPPVHHPVGDFIFGLHRNCDLLGIRETQLAFLRVRATVWH